MSFKNTTTTYGSVSRFFHWLIFLLVATLITVGYLMGGIEDKALKGQIVNVHKLIGILVLVLVLLRLMWAYINVKPMLPFQTPLWQKFAEHCMHSLLYLGLIIMPMSGWLGSIWAGRVPHIGGLYFTLPLQSNDNLAGFSFEYIHQPLAIILITLISIHVLAAFYHHFIKRDDILRRMLLGSKRR